jgi:cell division protein FtsB
VKFRRLLLPALFLGGAVYFAFFGGEYSAFELRALERQHVEELDRLATLRDSVAGLRARADSAEQDPATLERLARERFGMIRDGERLYRFVEPNPAPQP